MNQIDAILTECDADVSCQDSAPLTGIRLGRVNARHRELLTVLRPLLGRKGTERLNRRIRQHASALVANADRQVRTQERDLFGSEDEGASKRTGRLRNQLAENELHKYHKMASTSVLVTPSTKNKKLRGPGWGIGIDPPDPYVLAYLLGQLPWVDSAWEYGFDDESTLQAVAFVIGRCQVKATTNVSMMRPIPEDTPPPLTKSPDLYPEHVADDDDTEDPEYEVPKPGRPDLVYIHLPLPIDRWNIIDHVVAGTADLVVSESLDGLELASTMEAYCRSIYQRVQLLISQLRHAAVVAISTPATMGMPRMVNDCATDLGLVPAGTTSDHTRTYQEPAPKFLNDNKVNSRLPAQAGPRHPGNGSALPPRVLSLWTATPKVVS